MHPVDTMANTFRLITLEEVIDASGGYYGFRGGMPLPQCVDDFSLPLCSQEY